MAKRCATGRGGMKQASPAIVRAGAGRNIPILSSSPTTSLPGAIGALARQLPCSALVRTAMNLVIWLLSSAEPSTNSVITADLALTLSQTSSVLLFALQAATINSE